MKNFDTDKKQNFNSALKKFLFNIFPAYRRTGARICFISEDLKEVHVKLRLKWSTRNYVGTVFGGSIYGALDPIYMVQLINILGKKYVVWDKSSTIKFIRPIKHVVFARFLISDDLISDIKKKIELQKEMEIELSAKFIDENKQTYAKVTQKLYIADKDFYRNKKLNKSKSERNID